MENINDQLNHIKEMRKLMESSSRFLSLSGLSGILCGFYALVAAALAYYLVYVKPVNDFQVDPINRFDETYMNATVYFFELDLKLLLIAIATLVISLLTAFLLSRKQANKNGDSFWNPAAKNMLVHMLLPLFVGGIFGLICIAKGYIELVAPVTLIFYGLALISASKYTFGEVIYLGIIQSLLGLLALIYIGYGLFFWAAGFGVMHIVYGIILHRKNKLAA